MKKLLLAVAVMLSACSITSIDSTTDRLIKECRRLPAKERVECLRMVSERDKQKGK
jgi:hypothetical protein